MTLKIRLFLGTALFAGAFFCASFSGAQQQATPATQSNVIYDVSRETVLSGKVLTYTADSTVAPIGPHAMIQTSSGVVDVHLGNAQRLKAKGFTLASGDSVSIVGENVSFGDGPATFFARILRKGSQTVTLRNLKGIPLVAMAGGSSKPRSIFGGAQ